MIEAVILICCLILAYFYFKDEIKRTSKIQNRRGKMLEKYGSNPDIWIPNTKQLFELDEITGKEYLYIFASPERIEDFEGKTALSLKKKDIDNVIEIKKMGIAGLRQKIYTEKVVPPKKTQKVAEVKKKLQAEGAFVYETWFWHR